MKGLLVVVALLLATAVAQQLSLADRCAGFNCTTCANSTGCGWIPNPHFDSVAGPDDPNSSPGNCTSLSVLASVGGAFCSGSSCQYVCTDPTDCLTGFFPCSQSSIGSIILLVFYGVILGAGANLISDGAEGVLELYPAYGSVIGALLLPVLGALPDSMMIIVSGAFGSVAEAQMQLGVGVGTLAGSTIMLLTVPWSLCLFVAGCDLNEYVCVFSLIFSLMGCASRFGEAIEKRRSSWSLSRVGITVNADTRINARIMLVSTLSYFIVQGIAFKYLTRPGENPPPLARTDEYPWAVAGFAVCTVGLVAYCIYQLFVPRLAEARQEKLKKEREERNVKLRALYIVQHFPSFRDTIMPRSNEERLHANALHFARTWKQHALQKATPAGASSGSIQEDTRLVPVAGGSASEDSPLLEQELLSDEEENDEEAPDEDPREHFWKNLFISMVLMLGGTGIVAVFSDPMVDTISGIGNLWGIPVFYISFVLTPFCSNASELVASIAFASKKKVANTSMTYSQLYGAVVMNNTMGLGIFFALIAFRGLAWTFTAETLTIIFVIVCVGVPSATLVNFPLYWVFLNAPLYVISIVLVFVIEHYVDWA